MTTFADQAVIAIENARLLNDLRSARAICRSRSNIRPRPATCSRSSATRARELQPVLETLVETAARICEAEKAFIFQLRGRLVSHRGLGRISAGIQGSHLQRNPIVAGPRHGDRPQWHSSAVSSTSRTPQPIPNTPAANRSGSAKHARCSECRCFARRCRDRRHRRWPARGSSRLPKSRSQLVTTFADQAVIAIENARLFNELRARTTELGSSVAELKMLNEVAQAVSSTLDLRTVLSTSSTPRSA